MPYSLGGQGAIPFFQLPQSQQSILPQQQQQQQQQNQNQSK
jgi:hypothetical protein